MSHQGRVVPRNFNRCQPKTAIDTHELLKQEIYRQDGGVVNFKFNTMLAKPADGAISQLPNVGSLVNIPQTIPQATTQAIGFEDYELYFDSVNRDSGSDLTTGDVKWSISAINSTQDIKECVEIHMSEFYFPKIITPTGVPEYLYYRRVFLELTNTSFDQSILGPNNNKFHFEFNVDSLSGQAVKLTPIKDKFYFKSPITALSSFAIRLYTPGHSFPNAWRKIPIPPERVSVKSLLTGGNGYNPIRFRITSGELTTAVLDNVGSPSSPGIAAFITGFASNDATTNTAVNSTDGLYITEIINSTDFEVSSVDGSAITAEYGATLYIPKNRFAIPVRFKVVRNHATNFISATHD